MINKAREIWFHLNLAKHQSFEFLYFLKCYILCVCNIYIYMLLYMYEVYVYASTCVLLCVDRHLIIYKWRVSAHMG